MIDIQNIALIEELNIEIKSGMTVLTGETGAGKSIVIDAVNLLLGERTNKGLVRYGTQKSRVQGLFDLSESAKKLLVEQGFDIEDGQAVISREITAEGKSVCRINGSITTAGVLREVGAGLINIHGQHDNQALLNPSKHIDFLDEYAKTDLLAYTDLYQKRKGILTEIEKLTQNEQERLSRVDLLEYQVGEIEVAKLTAGEKEALTEQKNIIENEEKIVSSVSEAYSCLYEDNSAYDAVSRACNALERISGIDASIDDVLSKISEVRYIIEDSVHELSGHLDGVEYSENDLNEIEERLDLITKLERKYGGSIEAVLKYFENASTELEMLSNADESVLKLKKELEDTEKKLAKESEKITKYRKEFAKKLQGEIEKALSELDMPKVKFEVAIEAALGSAMQNIVTPTEEDAKALIEYLRRHDLGRATFLPISAVKGRTLEGNESNVIKMEGSFGLASDLITYDGIYSEVVKSLLGRTVIVDDLDTGISIQRKTGHSLKVVTLKGDVMNTGGSMSGGSLRQKTTSILGREREIEQLNTVIKETNGEIARINGIVENFDAKYNQFEVEVKQKDDELHALDIKFAHDIEKLNKLKADFESVESSENEIKLENEQLNDTLKEIETELENINTLEGDFENSNTEKGESISARQIEYNKKQLEREKLFQKLTDARVECAGLEKELDAMINNANRLGELIENLNQAKVKILAEGVSLEKQLEEAKKEKEESILKTGAMQGDLQKIQEKEKEEEANREKINAQLKENEEKRRRFEQEIYEAGERRHKVELQQTKVDNELQYLENRIWEEYELTQATAEEFRDPEFKVTGAQTEINRLKKSISALGNVNVNAIDEYVETKERFDDLSSQRDDLVKAENDLRQIIEELIKKMDKQFKEQFELINKHFAKTFSELFGGGKAELKLQDGETSLDADIEIVAQPPGKSLQLLSLLSGGERALTAIAILFAMLKLKPTPFCILDEIEAALDEANVGNFATYLRKFSKDTQFIVITHRKPTMEEADSLYGVAMEEKGISKIVSVKLT